MEKFALEELDDLECAFSCFQCSTPSTDSPEARSAKSFVACTLKPELETARESTKPVENTHLAQTQQENASGAGASHSPFDYSPPLVSCSGPPCPPLSPPSPTAADAESVSAVTDIDVHESASSADKAVAAGAGSTADRLAGGARIALDRRNDDEGPVPSQTFRAAEAAEPQRPPTEAVADTETVAVAVAEVAETATATTCPACIRSPPCHLHTDLHSSLQSLPEPPSPCSARARARARAKSNQRCPCACKQSEQEQETANANKPLLPDGSARPPTHRSLSLSPSLSSLPLGDGLVGLRNWDNNCYLNSIMQVLANTPALVRYFLGCICTLQYFHVSLSLCIRTCSSQNITCSYKLTSTSACTNT